MTNQLAVIGGSQAYSFIRSGELSGERIPPIKTPFGESQPIHKLHVGGHDILFMSRHGEEGYWSAAPWVNYRANIWALKEMGTGRIVSWSGPGAVDEALAIGQFVIPDDLIDETKARASSFFEGTGWGFVRQNPVFCPSLRSAIADVMSKIGVACRSGGVYVCTEGPRLETPAEVRKYRLLGGDMVGMTLAPEVFLAKELEMCYAAICYITNYAEGIADRPFTPGVLFEGLLDEKEKETVQDAVELFPDIIALLPARVLSSEPPCDCARLMERYRLRGDIGPDWRTWIR
ncbi:MAG TPA: MTAP family purine nucleoside phosphorylase [Armatimonadota bacterium]|nr:MTAP family purine nucleoside phosphorylase [Armatimonadota bacterium]